MPPISKSVSKKKFDNHTKKKLILSKFRLAIKFNISSLKIAEKRNEFLEVFLSPALGLL